MNGDLRARFGSLTAAQSTALDAAAGELGVDVAQLMEAAGWQVARLAWRLLGGRPRGVHVVAGHGNNGGDALVAARLLAGWGCAVTVGVLRDPSRLSPALTARCAAARRVGAEVVTSGTAAECIPQGRCALTIDGLLGTGLHEPPRGEHGRAIEGMRGPVLSIDVPSGLDASSGSVPGVAVRASTTCALAACKSGLWARDAQPWVGAIHVADIGMPSAAWERIGLRSPHAVRAGRICRVVLES